MLFGLFGKKEEPVNTCVCCNGSVDKEMLRKALDIVALANTSVEDGKLTRKERSAVMKGMWSLIKIA